MERVERNRALARWLRTHDGVISGDQASQLGVQARVRRNLVSSGRWLSPTRGVFVDAAAPRGPRTDLRIALCAAGPGAMASHRSAAWLWDLVDQPPARAHITVPRGRRLRLPGIVAHQTTTPPVLQHRSRIPVTDPIRTLIDMAQLGVEMSFLIDRALTHHLVTVQRLERATRPAENTQRAGTGPLRASLEERGYLGAPHPSVLESRMARVLVQIHRLYGLPVPEPERTIHDGRYRLDYAWPDIRLAVEVDGYVWHASASDLDRDHARRSALTAEGWTILVFTWHQVIHDPARVTATIVSTYRRLASHPAPAQRTEMLS